MFHGNRGSAVSFAYRAQPFIARGWRVILAEYRGYGARSGRPSEQALVQDACEVSNWVRAHRQGPLLIVGKSLGTGVAVQAAVGLTRRGCPPEHLILVTPYLSVAKVAEKWVPKHVVRWALKDRFESHEHLPGYTGPVTVVVALKDKVTEPAQGLALAQIAAQRGPTTLVQLPHAHHTDWYTHMTASQWDELLAPAVEIQNLGATDSKSAAA